MLAPYKTPPTDLDVRQQILEVTQRIAYGRGVSAVRMDEVAHELGMSKKTLYTHFRSKEELLEAMLTARYMRHQSRFKAVLANKELGEAAALEELMRLSWQASSEWSNAALRDMRRKAPHLWVIYQNLQEALIYKMLRQELARGQAQGWLRQDVRMDIFLDMFLNRTGYELQSEQAFQLDYSMRDVQDTFFSLMFNGILR